MKIKSDSLTYLLPLLIGILGFIFYITSKEIRFLVIGVLSTLAGIARILEKNKK